MLFPLVPVEVNTRAGWAVTDTQMAAVITPLALAQMIHKIFDHAYTCAWMDVNKNVNDY